VDQSTFIIRLWMHQHMNKSNWICASAYPLGISRQAPHTRMALSIARMGTYQVEGSTKVHSDESGPEYIHHPALDASNAFQECEQIQLDLRFGLPSRDIPPGTTYQNGAFYRPNGRFVEGSTKVHSDESGPEYIHHPALDASNAFQECSLASYYRAITVYRSWSRLCRDVLHNTLFICTM
jgi:hypothetical protein